MSGARPRILQIGYGAFGATHLHAWRRLGLADRLVVADPRPEALEAVRALSPETGTVSDCRAALAEAEAVDILTPTDTHHAIARAALAAGCHVFLEKPAVATAAQGAELARLAAVAGRVVQVGYYFRFHPKTLALRALMAGGTLGAPRFLAGRFAGFKRGRRDSGALANDAVHFLDLFAWLVGRQPDTVHAVLRDHFGRGLDDFALVTLEWEDGPVAQVEAGYAQPGRWPDAVVPGAVTAKEIAVSCALGAVEIDYAGETMARHAVRHVCEAGIWVPRFEAPPPLAVPAADPVEVVAGELAEFVARIADPDRAGRAATGLAADGLDGGLAMARLLEAAERSARERQVVRLAC